MRVYVVDTGCYEDRGVVGVYATPEAAMAAHPPRVVLPADYKSGRGDAARPGGWQGNETDGWDNGLDWDDAARITPWDVVEAAASSSASTSQ